MKGLAKLRGHSRVLLVDDERGIGNSLIVTMYPGWRRPDNDAEHVFGADTEKEALDEIRRAVPCDCAECRDLLRRVAEGENIRA